MNQVLVNLLHGEHFQLWEVCNQILSNFQTIVGNGSVKVLELQPQAKVIHTNYSKPYNPLVKQKCFLYVLQIGFFLKIPKNSINKAKFVERL